MKRTSPIPKHWGSSGNPKNTLPIIFKYNNILMRLFLIIINNLHCVLCIGGYHLEVDSGSVRWFHRDEYGRTVFSMMTSQLVIPRVWMHFTAVYDGYKGLAKVTFVDRLYAG